MNEEDTFDPEKVNQLVDKIFHMGKREAPAKHGVEELYEDPEQKAILLYDIDEEALSMEVNGVRVRVEIEPIMLAYIAQSLNDIHIKHFLCPTVVNRYR